MYKLNIGVGFSILKLYYLPHNNKSFIIDLIEQHRIILSEKIIEYYIEMVDELHRDIMETFIDSIIYTDDTHIYYQEQYNEESAIEEMIQLVGRNPMKVLLGESEEFKKQSLKKIKLITSEQILNRDNNPIYRYSFPVVNHYVRRGEICESYATWFGHLFEEEQEIEIQDKYILNGNGVECLKKYYLSYIAENTKINIYCETIDTCTETDILKELQKSFYTKWDIHVYLCNKMHDRYIQLNSIQISVGAGLDFLHVSGITKKSCTISITNYATRFPLPVVVKQLL